MIPPANFSNSAGFELARRCEYVCENGYRSINWLDGFRIALSENWNAGGTSSRTIECIKVADDGFWIIFVGYDGLRDEFAFRIECSGIIDGLWLGTVRPVFEYETVSPCRTVFI